MTLTETERETYGHDERAINRHCSRYYSDEHGNRYMLSRTLDGCPPFFEAYGPYKANHAGVLPRLKVDGQEYWGTGWNWRKALSAFCRTLNAVITKENMRHDFRPTDHSSGRCLS